MREKDRLNLDQINEVVTASTLRKTFSVGLKTLEGGGGGIGIMVTILTMLTLAGVTAAFLVEILAAIGGAAIFGAVALGMSYYSMWKDEQKVKKHKEDLDKKLTELRHGILEAIKNYQNLQDLEANIVKEITRLNDMVQAISDPEEQEHVSDKVRELNHDLVSVQNTKKDLCDQLKIVLTIVDGNTSDERLTTLFGRGGKEALMAASLASFSEADRSKIKTGIELILPKLQERVSDDAKANIYKDQLANLIKPNKITTHTGVKWANTALAGVGGLLGGAGSVITIAALVLGSMAAVTGIGWPIAVAALGVGLVAAGIAMLYQKSVERRQQKVMNKLIVANSQVNAMTKFCNDEVNKPVNTKITSLQDRYQKDQREIAVKLEVHRKTYKTYERDTKQHTLRIKSFINEVNKFHTFKTSDLTAIRELKAHIQADIVLLSALLKQVHSVAIISGSEAEKVALIKQIELLLQEAQQDINDSKVIENKIDKALHEPLVVIPAAKETLDKVEVEPIEQPTEAQVSPQKPKE